VAFGVLLDANALVPVALRDTLLRAAESYLYRPLWTNEILAEVERTLFHKIGLTHEQAVSLVSAIQEAFPEATVEGYADLIDGMTVSREDRHVVAAAIVGYAQVIVTQNLDDFPQDLLDPYNIEVQSPDEFLKHLFDVDPERMVQIIIEQAADLLDPPYTPMEICAHLRLFAPRFADLVEARLAT